MSSSSGGEEVEKAGPVELWKRSTSGAAPSVRRAARLMAALEASHGRVVGGETPILADWHYLGAGHLNGGDVLAAGVEASIRDGRAPLQDVRRGPPSED